MEGTSTKLSLFFFQKTSLHCACEAGNVEMVWLLIDRGADVNAKDKNGVRFLRF